MEKLRNLLGQAHRARKLALGRSACRRAAGTGRLHAVFVARDAGASAVRDSGVGETVACVAVDLDKEQLGSLVGRASVAILGVLDPRLATELLRLVEAESGPPSRGEAR
ncbi:MAG TPA: hypothetical protein VFE28_02055 [Candidatus Krumholzibacteria bacterium]|jgi:ribosomal protein L7Ae-like RNA K-turn-binding protein|nr:hypothetical protein [Candidatus Krumholzibacteria bacterium]